MSVPSHRPRGTCAEQRILDAFSVNNVGLLQGYGRCEPRGSGGTADRTIALVAKARDGDGLMAIVAETNAAPSRVLRTTNMHGCSVLHLAIKQELVRCCGSQGKSQTFEFTSIVVCP
jgi:hypothetical protein